MSTVRVWVIREFVRREARLDEKHLLLARLNLGIYPSLFFWFGAVIR